MWIGSWILQEIGNYSSVFAVAAGNLAKEK